MAPGADRSSGAGGFLQRLGAIGDRPDDDDAELLRHRLLVYMGVLMSFGGLLWGTISAVYELWLPAIIPYGYTVITIFNLTYFRFSKQFGQVRFLQVLISLLLPFLFQWSLGGFVTSGAVMLWAMLAIVGSHTFGGVRTSIGWLIVYSVLTIVSGVIESTVSARFGIDATPGARTAFFVVNVVVISNIVFGLTIYLLAERERVTRELETANSTIRELNEHLEDQVAGRTAELRQALARFKAILDNMADGLVAVDGDGRVQAANPAFADLLVLRDPLLGHPAQEVLPPELAALAKQCCDERRVIRLEIPLPGERIGSAVCSPIISESDGDEELLGSVVILRDVTLEKEIDRMKTDFIATVSHELRTPLTSVLGFAKITRNKLDGAIFPHVPEDDKKGQRALQQVRGNVDIIVSEGERLTALINDVLDISKMEAGRMEWRMEPLDPRDLVQRALTSSAALFEDGPVELKKDVEAELPKIVGDFDRLLQVLLNLISNASKFTEKGSVTVSARRARGGIELSVTDTGTGIDAPEQKSIFEKFKQVGDTLTNKPKGTGLGLPICKQIIEAHGGTLEVSSQLGEGSTFRFFVPGDVEQSAEMDAIRPSSLRRRVDDLVSRIESTVDRSLGSAGRGKGGDVLVVDDDANLRELLRQQLGDRGYGVRLASNGYEAIAAVRARRPDLIILDVMMPDISGFDVAAVLKSDPRTQSIPILILSIVQDAERGYSLGVDKYLTKPAEADVLVQEVARLLEQATSPRRVLVVDEQRPASQDVVRLLQTKGYHVVGTCTGEDCLEEAKKTRPDLIIVEAAAQQSDLIKTIRLEKDLAHVYVVQLMHESAAEAAEGDAGA